MNSEFKIIHEWIIPNGEIAAAVACLTHVTIAQGSTLHTFKIEKQGLVMESSSVQSDDVAFIIYEMNENQIGVTLFVALWRSNVIHVRIF